MKVELVHSGYPHRSQVAAYISRRKLVFNSPEWLQNYPDNNIRLCSILNNNNEIIGCFSYFEFRKLGLKFVITPPFAPNIDLDFINPSESTVGKNSFTKDLMDSVAIYFKSLKADYLSVYLPLNMVDTQPFTWNGFVAKTRYSYLIDLSQTKEQLWDHLSTEKRKSLNRAEKDKLEIREATTFDGVFDLIIKSLERNYLAKNIHIIRKILFEYAKKEKAFAYIAYQQGVPAGASFCVIDRNKAVYIFGGFDAVNKHHGAGVSCMWQCILKAKEMGLAYFDFEGSMNVRIERYFREFGGNLSPYYCVEKSGFLGRTLVKLKGN